MVWNSSTPAGLNRGYVVNHGLHPWLLMFIPFGNGGVGVGSIVGELGTAIFVYADSLFKQFESTYYIFSFYCRACPLSTTKYLLREVAAPHLFDAQPRAAMLQLIRFGGVCGTAALGCGGR